MSEKFSIPDRYYDNVHEDEIADSVFAVDNIEQEKSFDDFQTDSDSTTKSKKYEVAGDQILTLKNYLNFL